MKLWKKVLIIIIFILIILLIFLFIGKDTEITDVILKDYQVSSDGKTIKLNVDVSSSMGYIRDFRITQGAENQYITFYSTFGLNNKLNSKNEFEVELSPLCQKIYFYKGDGNYNLVLQKNQPNKWERPKETQNQNTVNENQVSIEERQYSLQKGDKFAKLGNIAVYLNDFDESIYTFNLTTKETKKLCKPENGANAIYFDGEFIYFVPYYYRGKGIYKLDLQGNLSKIYEGSSLQLWLTEDKIYFTDQIGFDDMNQTPQGNLCEIDKNGNNKKTILENVKNTFYLVDNFIYYTDLNTRSIYRATLEGAEKTEIAKGRTYITFATNQYLTYVDFSDGEKQRIVYLDNLQNNAVGRFGNIFHSHDATYFYTRKLLDKQNNIEDENTLFSIDLDNHAEIEHWKADKISLDLFSYVWKDYAYFKGNEYYRIKLNDKNDRKDLDFSSGFFIGGKCYSFKSTDGNLQELNIYDLDTLEKETLNINEK